MRSVALLLTLLLVAPGCFVLDELDAGAKIMDQHSPKNAEERETTSTRVVAAPTGKKGEEGPVARVQAWLEKRKADAEAARPTVHADDVPVRCEIRGSTQFLRKFDCQLRGGRIL
jgi:hypothetical protein